MNKTVLALALASAFAHPAQAAERFWNELSFAGFALCGGGFLDADCWGGNPAPGTNDIATWNYNHGSAYTVDFFLTGTIYNRKARVRRDNLIWQLSGQTYNLTADNSVTDPSLAIGMFNGETARLTIRNGTVTSARTVLAINGSSNGFLTLDGNARLYAGDGLTVGYWEYTNASIHVLSGSQLSSSGTAEIGFHATANGSVSVAGTGSRWDNDGVIHVGSSAGGRGTLAAGAGATVTATTLEGWSANSSISTGNTSSVAGGLIDVAELRLRGGASAVSFYGVVGPQDTGSSNNLHVGSSASISGAGSRWSTAEMHIGYGGDGALSVSGGGKLSTSVLNIDTRYGRLDILSGGVVETNAVYAGGTLNQTGGTHTVATELVLGGREYSDGIYNLSGGNLQAGSETLGNLGFLCFQCRPSTAVFNQSGGTHTVAGSLSLGAASSTESSFNLSGGTLSAGSIDYRNGPGTFHITGGALSFGNITSGVGSSSFNIDGGSLNFTGATISVSVMNIGNYLGTDPSLDPGFTLKAGQTVTTGAAYVGNTSKGSFSQIAGSNTTGYLTLGNGSTGSGFYVLSGGSLLTDTDVIGAYGSGSFTQSGGTHTVTDLYLGWKSGSKGTYALNGGTLNVGWFPAEPGIIKGGGTGTLILDGGTLNLYANGIDVSNLLIGDAASSVGSFSLASGKQVTAGVETIGNAGTGTFTQNGGAHTVTTVLTLGKLAGGVGTYDLKGGELKVASVAKGTGTGTVNVDGGLLTLTGAAIDVDQFNVGNAAGSTGSFTLDLGKSLTAVNVNIGHAGNGSFIQRGGTHTVTDGLRLGELSGSGGSYYLDGGILNVANISRGAGGSNLFLRGGTLNLTGTSIDVGTFQIAKTVGANDRFELVSGQSLTASSIAIGNLGSFTLGSTESGRLVQTGGTVTTSGLTIVLVNRTVTGDAVYELNGGSLTVNGNEQIFGTFPGQGSAKFLQSGGTHAVTRTLYVGRATQANNPYGSYALSGGSLSATDEIVSDLSSITQTGGTNTVTGTLTLGQDFFGAGGTYNLLAGSLSANEVMVGKFDKGSRFDQSGGVSTVASSLYIGGAGGGGSHIYQLRGGSLSAAEEYIGLIGGAGTLAISHGAGHSSVSAFVGNAAGAVGQVSISGAGSNWHNSGSVYVGGGLQEAGGEGLLTVESGATLAVQEKLKLWNSGSIDLRGGSIAAAVLDSEGDIGISGGVLSVAASDIAGSILVTGGTLRLGGGGTHALRGLTQSTPLGTIQGDGAGTVVNLSGDVVNGGTLNANAGATVNLTPGLTMPNAVTRATAGGEVNVMAGAGLEAGFVEADGPGSRVDIQAGSFVNLAILQALNAGNLNIDGVVNGGSVRTFLGGTLTGSGTINANVFNARGGNLEPGNSPGQMSIAGDYLQDADSALSIEIGGALVGAYDQLIVGGTAYLNGSLNLTLYDPGGGVFAPQAGDSFDVLTAETLDGRFSTLNQAPLAPRLVWNIAYLTDAVGSTDVVRLSVTAVPEPGTYLMMLTGLGLLGTAALRRKAS